MLYLKYLQDVRCSHDVLPSTQIYLFWTVFDIVMVTCINDKAL